MRNLTIIAALTLFGFSSCKKNPIDRLTNPLPGGAVPQSSGIFIIYQDELKTGGGLGFIPGGENQAIDLANADSPRLTNRQILYAWNGSPTGGQQLFAGFQLLVTSNESGLASATGKNVSAAGYTKMSFDIRGSTSSDNVVRVQGPAAGTEAPVTTCAPPDCMELSQLDGDWRHVELPVSAGHFTNVKIFATFSFQYSQAPRTTNPGAGGSIYIDNIRYEK